jgi:hypothetical protein
MDELGCWDEEGSVPSTAQHSTVLVMLYYLRQALGAQPAALDANAGSLQKKCFGWLACNEGVQ